MGQAEDDREAQADDQQEHLIVEPIKTWRGYAWNTWELPSDQRWLLFKLDAFVLTFASVNIRSLTGQHGVVLIRTRPDRILPQEP